MSKKFNAKERDKLAQELIAADLDFDLDILGPSKNPRKSFNVLIKIVFDSKFRILKMKLLNILDLD
jgi:hypothetical protein